ncbi:MAG: 4-(cytidine 5'-diphospho)-2-C-methyl-D-erythritol kinase [Gemmatimonadaceae bacterium]
MRAARVAAEAKVNLVLRVLAREEGGYHQIETVFQRIALADIVTVREASGRTLDVGGIAVPRGGVGPVEQNLAYRAALAYRETAGWPAGFAIELDKRVPTGGGLGGGSADAAAVLRLLETLAPSPVGLRALMTIAARLGADVAFLACGIPLALAWGRGERMFALPALPPRNLSLVCFDFGVATRDAYVWLAEARRTAPRPVEATLLTPRDCATWSGVAALAANDFESPVGARHAELRRVLDGLRRARELAGAIVLMAGSGSTVFVVHGDTSAAALGATRDGYAVVATRTVERAAPVEVM